MVATMSLCGNELMDLDIQEIEAVVREVCGPYPEFIGFKIVSMNCQVIKFNDKKEGKE